LPADCLPQQRRGDRGGRGEQDRRRGSPFRLGFHLIRTAGARAAGIAAFVRVSQ
jgi:hypothetical protein